MLFRSEITLGGMMAFMTLASYFMDPVSRLVSLQLSIQESNISMKRLSEILDYETEQDIETKGMYQDLDRVDGDIAFKDVTFRYGNRKLVLKNMSFEIPKGKKVAMVGASRSGKSTVAKLLLKYYEPEEGEITIDDVDINEYTNESIRKSISYVPDRKSVV